MAGEKVAIVALRVRRGSRLVRLYEVPRVPERPVPRPLRFCEKLQGVGLGERKALQRRMIKARLN